MVLAPIALPLQEIHQSIHESKKVELKSTLLACYGVNQEIADLIVSKLIPFLEDRKNHVFLDEFMMKSKQLGILAAIPAKMSFEIEEGLQKYPSFHTVLFESDHVRILFAETKSGVREPLQIHPWKSLMIITKASQFESQNPDGSTFTDDWPIGFYFLDPMMSPSACKNIGSSDFQGLIFEIKQ